MLKKHITIMINSTIPDMFAEHYYFIREIFPKLREIAAGHSIDMDYVDLAFSMSKEEFDRCRSILKYFRSIDSDRTFFICFRGQKLGCVPTPEDIDEMTLKRYPELVDYIGDISFTELNILHALHPFEAYDGDEHLPLDPVKHSMFYFRNDDYLDGLNDDQKLLYTCKPDCGDEFVQDLKLAMAKDLVFENKNEFDSLKDNVSRIRITRYDGIWDENLDLFEVIRAYAEEYGRLNQTDDDLMVHFNEYAKMNTRGCFADFKCGNRPLKDVIIDEFVEELKAEFPQNFE